MFSHDIKKKNLIYLHIFVYQTSVCVLKDLRPVLLLIFDIAQKNTQEASTLCSMYPVSVVDFQVTLMKNNALPAYIQCFCLHCSCH